MSRLSGKRILVTAAAAGIGRETALAFAEEGANVIAADIDEDQLTSLETAAPSISPLKLDVTNDSAVHRLPQDVGEIDVLCNFVGWVHHGSILECSRDDWDRSLALNLTSMYELSRAFLPMMIERKSGNIINMSSVASSVTGAPNRFAYGATKAGVIGFTKAIAADFVRDGIRCNAICPGTVETPSLQARMRAQGDYESARAAFIERQPMGRLGSASEIASLAVYLASDESGFTTGTINVIDGGWTA